MRSLNNLMLLAGRIMIAALFIFDATVMVRSWEGTSQYMQDYGIPGVLLPAVALFQFAGGVLIVFGVWTRLVSLAFAAFCVATAVVFHRNLGSTNELIQAGKDLGLAGGFLFLAANGPGAWAIRR